MVKGGSTQHVSMEEKNLKSSTISVWRGAIARVKKELRVDVDGVRSFLWELLPKGEKGKRLWRETEKAGKVEDTFSKAKIKKGSEGGALVKGFANAREGLQVCRCDSGVLP